MAVQERQVWARHGSKFNFLNLLKQHFELPDFVFELLAIPGVGPRKLAAYGDAFLALLREK